jgi:ABC-type transport system involved in multi-copper enzyme maturation permease subunit
LSVTATCLFALLTIQRLNYGLFDRSRAAGVITDDRTSSARAFRRMFFLVDPQRRKTPIGRLVNPVMVKEFRCRRFGRMHWLLRLAAASALVSLLLTYATTMGTMDWGLATIGGIMVLLQAALIVLITPSLTAGLISTEIESGGWELLQMTPLSAGKIVRGKLSSVIWPVVLILVSTVPGYVVMVYIQPDLWLQIRRVLICLGLTAVLSISLSLACSACFRRTAAAMTTAYASLLLICGGTLLVWLLRDVPFGYETVRTALVINPIAAALQTIGTPGFGQYHLVPANWWCVIVLSAVLSLVVVFQVHRRLRPQ